MKQKLFELVNAQKKSKSEAIFQLGLALRRLIVTMEDHHDLDLPLLFSKLDIKYGFLRMAITDKDA